MGLNDSVDSDNDGYTDAVEIAANTSPSDSMSRPIIYPDFSDTVDAEIGSESGLDSIEGNLALWLDAANITGTNNVGLTDNQAVDAWFDMSNGNSVVAVASKEPTFSTTSFNGAYPGVTFDNDKLVATDIGSLVTGQEADIFVVVNWGQKVSK